MRYLIFVIGLVFASPGIAQGGVFLSADGSAFQFEKNRHGAVLTAVTPQANSLFANTESNPRLSPGDVLYLGRSCDAFTLRFGEGNWNTTDDGVLVQFGTIRVAFPGQAMDITSGNACRM